MRISPKAETLRAMASNARPALVNCCVDSQYKKKPCNFITPRLVIRAYEFCRPLAVTQGLFAVYKSDGQDFSSALLLFYGCDCSRKSRIRALLHRHFSRSLDKQASARSIRQISPVPEVAADLMTL